MRDDSGIRNTVDPPLPARQCTIRKRSGHVPGAAEDLLEGITHRSPRDFSLAHFAHSKERDDAAYLLADAGVPDEIAAALGIRR